MDQTKYINAYIEVAMATINENSSQLLQLKTQVKVTNDMLSEKDGSISNLNAQIDSLNQQINDLNGTIGSLNTVKAQNEELLQQHAGTLNKLSHMDGLIKQISDMKQEVTTRDGQINSLKQEVATRDEQINSLKTEPLGSVIADEKGLTKKMNSKKPEALIQSNQPKTIKPVTLDDF